MKLVALNWKMNLQLNEAMTLAAEIDKILASDIDILVCPASLYLSILKFNNTNIQLGAQNCSEFDMGAYTGEIGAKMLKSIGIKYCIIGHSERRANFFENDITSNKKAIRLLENGITPIICIGESLLEYKANQTAEIISKQLSAVLVGITEPVVIAYEPIWAIGSGLTPSAQEIESIALLIKNFSSKISHVLYGGSVNSANVSSLAEITNLDGFLVGGASLKINEVESIVRAMTL